MISRLCWVWCVVMCLGLALGGPVERTCSAEDAVKSLLPYLPESSNVVAVIRVDKVLNSPRGKTEGWASKQQEKFLAGASSIPPHVSTVVTGMLVRPQLAELVSSVGLAWIPGGVHLESIAEREEGVAMESIGGCPAVHSKLNAFYIELSSTVLAIVSPAARQESARYARRVTSVSNGGVPAGYLGEAAMRDHQVLIAMDLVDLGNPARVREEIEKLPGVAENTAVRDELLDLMSSVQGVCFSADVDEFTRARLTVDFNKQPGNSAKLLKGLALKIISEAGLHVSELDEALISIEGNRLVLSMPNFSDASLRMVLSLITPSAPVPTAAPAVVAVKDKPATPNIPAPKPDRTSTTSSPSFPDATASLRYFRSVNQCLDDLQTANRRNSDPGQFATWHENMARKIDKLPTRGVDPGLVDYGSQMSERLRAVGASLRGIAIEVNAAQNSIVWNSTYDPGYAEANFWGGYGYRAPSYQVSSNLQQVREKQADAVVRGAKDREAAWVVINNERQRMTQQVNAKYGSK
jgi:hypothetical protein